MKVLVSVGTTHFDALVRRVDSQEVQEALGARGFLHIECQLGTGTYKPQLLWFDFDEKIEERVGAIDLLICHAGAGSILSGLRHHKKVIAVVNESVMGDHQRELASELSNLGCILSCSGPDSLLSTVFFI